MAKILIIDDTAIVRDPLAASLKLAGYQTETANDGKEGLAKARAAPPDVVLLDVAIPEMDGLAVVEAMRADPALSEVGIILLTALADRRTVVKAAQLGIKDYLLKSRFSMAELLERVQRHLARPRGRAARVNETQVARTAAAGGGDELPRLLTREQCLARVERATGARPLSGVVSQVLSMASSPVAEMSDMAALIGQDPVLSARVLRAANSAAFTKSRKVVSTIAEAVRNIGMGTVRNITTALSVFEAVPSGGAGDGSQHMRSWQHAFAVAMICQHLAEVGTAADSGAAYLVGLCHDLGQILFRGEFGVEYEQVLAAQSRTQKPLEDLERHMLGTTQLELAKVILKKMSLPENIRQPIEEFHTIRGQQLRQMSSHKIEPLQAGLPLARILHLAELKANGILMAALATSEVGPLTKVECRAATGRDDPSPLDAAAVRGQILALTPMLARLPAAEEAKLCQPILSPSQKRVWLAREAIYSTFDPIAAALASLASVTVSSNLPDVGEQAQCDALIVVARQRYPLAVAGSLRVLRISPSAASEGTAVVECGATASLERLAEFIGGKAAPVRTAA